MSLAEVFEPFRAALERAGIRHAVGGSWASTAYGEPRFTNNVDILAEFTRENVRGFVDNLPDTFYADAEEALRSDSTGQTVQPDLYADGIQVRSLYCRLVRTWHRRTRSSHLLGRYEPLESSYAICHAGRHPVGQTALVWVGRRSVRSAVARHRRPGAGMRGNS